MTFASESIANPLNDIIMCMRPCGPVRHHYSRPTRLVTKKEIYELLDENALTITVEADGKEVDYEGTVSKVKAAVKSGDASVDQAGYSSRYYLEDYRTILVEGSSIAPVIIMRKKR